MSILLTDMQKKQVADKLINSHFINDPNLQIILQNYLIEAQLKAVVEWGNEQCMGHSERPDMPAHNDHQHARVRQAPDRSL